MARRQPRGSTSCRSCRPGRSAPSRSPRRSSLWHCRRRLRVKTDPSSSYTGVVTGTGTENSCYNHHAACPGARCTREMLSTHARISPRWHTPRSGNPFQSRWRLRVPYSLQRDLNARGCLVPCTQLWNAPYFGVTRNLPPAPIQSCASPSLLLLNSPSCVRPILSFFALP